MVCHFFLIGRNCNYSFFVVPETVCIAPFYVRSKDFKFALHLEGSNAEFSPHMERSHADFNLHTERQHSFRDQQIDKTAISANCRNIWQNIEQDCFNVLSLKIFFIIKSSQIIHINFKDIGGMTKIIFF